MKVRILGHDLDVQFVPEDDLRLDDAWGRLYLDEQLIVISKELSGTITRETLFHEILHAADFMGSPRHLSEAAIHRISAVMFAALRDNPEIVKWLLEERDDD